ncbi:MAG TPA: hypothetical protein VFJ74_09255 [Gemmatimonadaceae bacterium]|nr:hypothetical protein [Gemmatimonadaceae bacterium]
MTGRPGNGDDRPPRSSAPGAPAVDAERIAALLDGRLDERQRAALLKEIDADPSAFEPFVDAIAVLRELDAEQRQERPPAGGAVPTDIRRLPWRVSRFGGWMAIAAALLIAVAGPFLWRARTSGGGSGRAFDDPMQLAARLEPAAAVSANDWRASAWDERRGAGAPLSVRGRAVRIGARVVDLELLARASDSSAARVALEIASLLEDIPAASGAAHAYDALAQSPGGVGAPEGRRRALHSAEQVTDVRDVRAGAWLEAARVAASRRDTAFFRAPGTSPAAAELVRLAGDAAAAPAAREAATRLESAVAAPALDWPALTAALDDLLRELAR